MFFEGERRTWGQTKRKRGLRTMWQMRRLRSRTKRRGRRRRMSGGSQGGGVEKEGVHDYVEEEEGDDAEAFNGKEDQNDMEVQVEVKLEQEGEVVVDDKEEEEVDHDREDQYEVDQDRAHDEDKDK